MGRGAWGKGLGIRILEHPPYPVEAMGGLPQSETLRSPSRTASRCVSRPLRVVGEHYSGALMGGLDEVNFRTLSADTLRAQYEGARQKTGKRFILTPGCSMPNDSTNVGLMRVAKRLEG